ncbi:dihydropteroate synthase [Streptomyces sp. NPDC047061]|uniref:dihydropteroate synthase n=1 Tax=Streptomyces sp. NPDC047061 TaxID=3154605 RepID=UPI0033D3F181
MGILNVTPDSFSDGGLHADTAHAVEHGFALAADGADIVDVGGESTRPGARPVPEREELARVLPVVRELAAGGVRVSIDTMHASVAQAAVNAGASMVNDVSGGLADPRMADIVADTGMPYVVMHWRAPSHLMQRHADYQDVVQDVPGELCRRIQELSGRGVREEQIVLDPGLGFAKRPEHDWALLAHLSALTALGLPVLVGASRKSFLTTLHDTPSPAPATERDAATTAVSALAAAAGAWGIRVHNVPANRDAVRVAAAWRAGRTGAGWPGAAKEHLAQGR